MCIHIYIYIYIHTHVLYAYASPASTARRAARSCDEGRPSRRRWTSGIIIIIIIMIISCLLLLLIIIIINCSSSSSRSHTIIIIISSSSSSGGGGGGSSSNIMVMILLIIIIIIVPKPKIRSPQAQSPGTPREEHGDRPHRELLRGRQLRGVGEPYKPGLLEAGLPPKVLKHLSICRNQRASCIRRACRRPTPPGLRGPEGVGYLSLSLSLSVYIYIYI